MNRTEFITLTAIILFAAFILGWVMRLLVARLTRPAKADMNELDRMAQQLHEAEEERDAALEKMKQREAELQNRLVGAEADRQAMMDALRDSRSEIEELRVYIEQKLNRR